MIKHILNTFTAINETVLLQACFLSAGTQIKSSSPLPEAGLGRAAALRSDQIQYVYQVSRV